jgi:hypothetical protein
MKTAMQLMLEDLELRYKVLSNAEMLQACGAIEGTIEYAKSLIIKEKEQIMNAYVKGFDISAEGWNGEYGIKDFNNIKEEIKAEELYNQTYNN